MAIAAASRIEEEHELCHAEQGGRAAATILLVEDEAFVREVTGEVLRSAGYRVLIAKNSEEADLQHKSYGDEIDLLITDVVLPSEDGRALAQKLRERQPELRALFVTGYGNRMEGNESLEWLAKPFSGRVLLERVGKLLSRENEAGAGSLRRAFGGESHEESGWGFERAGQRG